MDDFGTRWGELSKLIRGRWMSLKNEDVAAIDGNQQVLVELLREKYGYSELQAVQEVERFLEENNVVSAP